MKGSSGAVGSFLIAALAWGVGFVLYPWLINGTKLFSGIVAWDFAKVGFVAALIGIASFLVGIGQALTEKPQGILFGARNTYSLSRFQMVLWTWLILSALMAYASARAWGYDQAESQTALAITIPTGVLEVLGISFASAALSPAVQTIGRPGNSQHEGPETRVNGTFLIRDGLAQRFSQTNAKIGDMVRGDDVNSAKLIDLGKVQNLLITLILVVHYSIMTFGVFGKDFNVCVEGKGCSTSLPDFLPGMVILLLISHSGYLANKAVSRPDPGEEPLAATTGPAPSPGRNSTNNNEATSAGGREA